MALMTLDGLPLLVDGALANSEDCCCGEPCCEFLACDTGDPDLLVLCGTLPVGLIVGDIIEIANKCYTYNGEVACVGGEVGVSYGDLWEDCTECIGCRGCDPPAARLPDTIHATFALTPNAADPCGDKTIAALSGTYPLYRLNGGSCTWESDCIEITNLRNRAESCEGYEECPDTYPYSMWFRLQVIVSGADVRLIILIYNYLAGSCNPATTCNPSGACGTQSRRRTTPRPCVGETVTLNTAIANSGTCGTGGTFSGNPTVTF